MLDLLFGSRLSHPYSCEIDGQDEDEKTLYIFRRSFITNLDWIFVSILMLLTPLFANAIFIAAGTEASSVLSPFFVVALNLFWYLLTFGFVFQNFINWFFNIYVITDKRIVDIDFVGILYKNISETSLDNIEDVTSTVGGALRIIFNYGTVAIQTAGEKREFDFEDVWKPAEVRDIIADIIVERKRNG